ERVDDAGLAGHARDDLAPLAAAHARVDPLHGLGIRCDDGVDEQTLERMVEIPVVDDVLEVPDDLARVGVERERRVVIEVLLLIAAEHVLRRGRRDRRADVDAVQLGIEARDHPHADVPTLLVRDVAPGFVAGLAGLRDRARAPQFAAGLRVEGRDDARLGPTLGLAASPRDDLAVHDDRTGAVLGPGPVVEDFRLPDELAGTRVQRVGKAVRAVVEDQVVVDREIAVRLGRWEVLADVLGNFAAMLPDEVAGHRVQSLCDVVRVRKEKDAVVHERRSFLIAAVAERPRPYELQLRDVANIDLVERAVAPVVQRAPPHRPIGGGGVREHRIGDGREIRDRFLSGGRRESRGSEDGNQTGKASHRASLPGTNGRVGILAQKARSTAWASTGARRLTTAASRYAASDAASAAT